MLLSYLLLAKCTVTLRNKNKSFLIPYQSHIHLIVFHGETGTLQCILYFGGDRDCQVF